VWYSGQINLSPPITFKENENMKKNNALGAFLAFLGIVAGILSLYFLADTYNTVIHTHFAAGQWEESKTVRIVYAVLGWLGIAAGGISAAVLWGFPEKTVMGMVLGSSSRNDSLARWILPHDPSR
jgi:hypothetical protein